MDMILTDIKCLATKTKCKCGEYKTFSFYRNDEGLEGKLTCQNCDRKEKLFDVQEGLYCCKCGELTPELELDENDYCLYCKEEY